MYPRNAASPPRIAIGPVVQISDGAVQTSGCTVRVLAEGQAEADGGGTTSYSTDGVVCYVPTQAETNYTAFVLIAKKTGCIPATVTVVTSASATAGKVVLSGETHTSAVIPTVTTTTTATNLTNLPAITNNWLTAAGIAADALAAIGAKVEAMVLDEGDATALLAAIAAKVEAFLINEGDATATIAAIAAACNSAVVAGTVGANVGAIKAKTDNLPASPAAVGDIPTTAQVADAVWDEALAGHAVAGSAGQALSAAGSAADPLLNDVPGSYAAGTAGEALGFIDDIKAKTDLIVTGTTTIVSPVNASATKLTLIRGDDYTVASGQTITITDSGSTWPDLTGATVTLTIRNRETDAVELTATGTVVDPGTATQDVRFEPTDTETVDLTTGTNAGKYDVQATLAGGAVRTLAYGTVTVIEDQTRAV